MTSDTPSVPYLSTLTIRRIATAFLSTYHASFSVPVPIEEIAEISMRIVILPTPKLEEYCGYDGFITGNFSTIMIDERVFKSNQERTRFTIAHELGHMMLHRVIYDSSDITNQDDFINFLNAFSSSQWGYLETQANKFAECMLFPNDETFRAIVEDAILTAHGETNFTFSNFQSLLERTMKTFFVSEQCALVKLKRDFPSLVKAVAKAVPF